MNIKGGMVGNKNAMQQQQFKASSSATKTLIYRANNQRQPEASAFPKPGWSHQSVASPNLGPISYPFRKTRKGLRCATPFPAFYYRGRTGSVSLFNHNNKNCGRYTLSYLLYTRLGQLRVSDEWTVRINGLSFSNGLSTEHKSPTLS